MYFWKWEGKKLGFLAKYLTLEDVDTDGIDDDSFKNVMNVPRAIGTPVLEEPLPIWERDDTTEQLLWFSHAILCGVCVP